MDDSDRDQKPLDVELISVGAVEVDDAVSSSTLMLLMAFWEKARRFSLVLGMCSAVLLLLLLMGLFLAGNGDGDGDGRGGGAFSMMSVGVGDRLAAPFLGAAEGCCCFMFDRGGAGIR